MGLCVWERCGTSEEVGRGVTGDDHQCRNPQGRGGRGGRQRGCTDGDETKAEG